ncbi:YggS family pyridoxal phosphate-dependent enzyme [Hamadaea tsunoensis]|uniref:YggS family pyridoxal phosphate-dependent enzyme n=1 Tax=Hamadaea tsunoensis TaxID=53368 RepID=UPI00041731D7|nr:YggS family pyridoxal phosphate-dependent enzyme [Hamadaea tsunoensis]
MSLNDGAVDRYKEIAANLAAVRERIAAACVAAERSPDEITLVAITKTYPATDVLHLAALGILDVGENKDQDAAPKAAEVRTAGVDVRWHFVGQLQRNKARSVAAYAAMVHSVDRISLVTALEKAADGRTEPLEVLIQVSLDADPGDRGGTPTDQVGQLAAAIAATRSLRLRGVMAVAPLDGPPGPAFARLSEVAATLRSDHPNATVISAGMSGDLEEAIFHGATHVRVGSALLGKRAQLG